MSTTTTNITDRIHEELQRFFTGTKTPRVDYLYLGTTEYAALRKIAEQFGVCPHVSMASHTEVHIRFSGMTVFEVHTRTLIAFGQAQPEPPSPAG